MKPRIMSFIFILLILVNMYLRATILFALASFKIHDLAGIDFSDFIISQFCSDVPEEWKSGAAPLLKF